MDAAAGIALAGFSVQEYLNIRDPFTRNLWEIIANRVNELRRMEHENLAIMISNYVWKAVK